MLAYTLHQLRMIVITLYIVRRFQGIQQCAVLHPWDHLIKGSGSVFCPSGHGGSVLTPSVFPS